MIEETHKRGMEFHAWFNPYRVTTSGPMAAKFKTPIVLVDTELSNDQKQILSTKQASLIYEIGGGINPSAVQDLINRVR